MPKVVAYEVTDNRGRKKLVYADSVEHANAVMFGYDIEPLIRQFDTPARTDCLDTIMRHGLSNNKE